MYNSISQKMIEFFSIMFNIWYDLFDIIVLIEVSEYQIFIMKKCKRYRRDLY